MFSRVSECDIVCSSLLGEEEHRIMHIKIEFHVKIFFHMHTLWQHLVGVLLLMYWINTRHVCVAINNELMFLFVFPDLLLVIYYCNSVKSWNHVYETLTLKGE
jgi:hypothetical protein